MIDLQLLGLFLLVGLIFGVVGIAIGMAMGRKRIRTVDVYTPKDSFDAPF